MLKKFAVCFSVSLLSALTVFCYSQPLFKGYARKFTVYFGSASSSGTIERVDGKDFPLFNKYGESFRKNNGEVSPEEILQRFNAKTVFTEKIAEGISYYAYSDMIPYVKTICGKKINLHIFVGKEQTTVGSPIIFGSF